MEKRVWYLIGLLLLLYRPLLAVLLIFFLPGLGFVLNLFKKAELHEKVALSIALSLSLVVINGFFLNMTFGLSFFSVFFSLLLISLVPLAIYIMKEKIDLRKLSMKMPSQHTKAKLLLLLLCLVVLGVKVYQPHFDNHYPLHLDEYSRLLETTHIIEQQSWTERYNPQFVGHPEATQRLNPGFQFIFSQFFILSGTEIIGSAQYLPAIFAVLTGFILFSFLMKISGFWTGLFAILFLSLMKSNDNTGGIVFLIALTITFPLLYSMMYSLYSGFDRRKIMYFLLAAVIYFAVLVSHEQTGAAFFPIIVLYLFISFLIFAVKAFIDKDIKLSVKAFLVAVASIIVPLFSLYVARELIWKGTLDRSVESFMKLIVWGTSKHSFSYNFIEFYGPVLTVLAVIGAIMIVRNFKMTVFIAWSLVAVGQVVNFYFNHITYFSFIERVRHHAVLGLVPLSAYGLYSLIDLLSNLSKKQKEKAVIISSAMLIVVISIFSLTYVDTGKYLPDDKQSKDGTVISPTLAVEDYNAILFIRSISEKNVVLADPKVSAAVYPVSRNYILASAQNPGDGFGGGRLTTVSRFFSTPSCTEKQDIAYKNNVQYILSPKPIDCPSFKELYNEDFRYVYGLE